jgi:hypothetical protein
VRCTVRWTVATSFTDSAIIRVSSWKRVKRSISSGSKDCEAAFRGFHARGDLRLGLHLDVAQLATQAVEVVCQVVQTTIAATSRRYRCVLE